MQECNCITEPFLSKRENGSVVFYRGKPLYSQYAPARSVLQVIDSTVFQPRTLVLLASPVLDYGIRELLAKLGEHSYVLAVQPDDVLYNFSMQHLTELHFSFLQTDSANFSFEHFNSAGASFSKVLALDEKFDFSRCILIRSSVLPASDNVQKNFFDELYCHVEHYLKSKAVNRLTLIKMGHGIAGNFFKNLKEAIQNQTSIYPLENLSVKKPILIIGAGASFDAISEKLVRHRNTFFIIAVDAVAKAVSEIFKPDAVPVLESQVFIADAFAGFANCGSPPPMLFADLTSQPSVVKNAQKHGLPVLFYFTEYASAEFLRRFKNADFVSGSFESAGSVGLSAIQLALNIRTDESVPIFVSGLDFAYRSDFTHSKYSFQVANRFAEHSRLNPLFVGAHFFDETVLHVKNSQGEFFSTPALQAYSKIFDEIRSKVRNIHVLDSFARSANQTVSFDAVLQLAQASGSVTPQADFMALGQPVKKPFQKLSAFLSQTISDLETIRKNLTGQNNLSKAELKELLAKNDFLFLHFPDYSTNLGDKILEQSFLKRVRIEVEYFYKFLA